MPQPCRYTMDGKRCSKPNPHPYCPEHQPIRRVELGVDKGRGVDATTLSIVDEIHHHGQE